jgi:hypothetical protein
MRKSFIAIAAVLLFGGISGASERPPVVQEVIHATPEKIKKVAHAMFVPEGYTIDSDTASQLKISRPMSSEEITRYNTENWTNPSVSNCRHMLTLILLPGNQAISVTISVGTVCHADGYDGFWKMWNMWSRDNEKDVQWMQTTLANLKAKIERADQGH